MKKLFMMFALVAMCLPRAWAQTTIQFYHYDRETGAEDTSIEYMLTRDSSGGIANGSVRFGTIGSGNNKGTYDEKTLTIPDTICYNDGDTIYKYGIIEFQFNEGNSGSLINNRFSKVEKLEINCKISGIGDYFYSIATNAKVNYKLPTNDQTRAVFYNVQEIVYRGGKTDDNEDKWYSKDGVLYMKTDEGSAKKEIVAWVPMSSKQELSTIISDNTKEILPYAFYGYFFGKTREDYAQKVDATVSYENNSGVEIDLTQFSLTKIHPWAFQGAFIKKVTFHAFTAPNNVVETGVFADCYNLEKVILHDAVNKVSSYAFVRCLNLNEINLKNVVAIGNFSFYRCGGQERTPYIDSKESLGGDQLSQMFGNQKSATQFTQAEFKNRLLNDRYETNKANTENTRSLTSLDLSSCQSIGLCAFKFQNKLEEVKFSPDLVSLDDEAFHMTKISDIDLSMASGLKTIPTHCFCSFGAIFSINSRTLKLPSGIETIRREAFASRVPMTIDGMDEKVLDLSGFSSLKEVGQAAFDGATAETVNLPTSIETIDGSSLYGLWNCKEIQIGGDKNGSNAKFQVQDGILFNNGMTTIVRYPQARQNKGYIVPATVTTLGRFAFEQYNRDLNNLRHKRGLQHLVLPSGLTTIEPLALFQEHPYDYDAYVHNNGSSKTAAALRDKNTTVERPYPAENWMPEITIPATVTIIKNYSNMKLGYNHSTNAATATTKLYPTYYLNNLGLGNYYAIYFMHNAEQLAALTIEVPLNHGPETTLSSSNSAFFFGSAVWMATGINAARGAFRTAATADSPGHSTLYFFKPNSLNAATTHTVLKTYIRSSESGNYAQKRWHRSDIPVRFTSVGKASICRDFDVNLDGSGITAYAATTYDADNKEVELIPVKYGDKNVGKYIPSRFSTDNHSYMGAILKLDADYDASKTYTYTIGEDDYTKGDDRLNPTTDMYNDKQNILGAVVHTNAVQGEETGTGYTYFGLAGDGMFQRFAWSSGTGEERIAYNKAYLRIKDYKQDASGAKVSMFFKEPDDDITGINTIDSTEPTVNTTDAWFTIDGRRLNARPTTKGIYIHNGRKEVLK